MTGKQYYRSTLAAWKQNLNLFQNSSWIPTNPSEVLTDDSEIVVYIEASETTHQLLSEDVRWHPMSLTITGTQLCKRCVEALSAHGISQGDTMFSVARKLQKIHSGLAPQRF
jgi:hypothetical protein